MAGEVLGTVSHVAGVGLGGWNPFPDTGGHQVLESRWTEFLIACEDHRVLGLLPPAERAGALVLADYQREAAELRLRYWLSHDLIVERRAQDSARLLEGAGIEYRLLKGVVLANSLYPDPSMRVFADVDLVVRSADFTRAAGVLASGLDATRVLPELRPGFDDRFGREILLRCGPVEIDLHRTLVDGPFGARIDLRDLFERPRVITIGDQQLQTVSLSAQFVHACFSALLGEWPPRLMVLRDVLEHLGPVDRSTTVDAAEVIALATRWGARAVVAVAIRRAIEDLGVRPDHELPDHELVEWATTFRPSLLDRLLLRTYRGRARGYTSQLATVVAIHGWAAKAAYLRAITRPSSEYLVARGFRRGERLRRALGLIRR